MLSVTISLQLTNHQSVDDRTYKGQPLQFSAKSLLNLPS